MAGAAEREQVYELFADSTLDFETAVIRTLEIGASYLDLDIGFLTRIRDGAQEILYAIGDHPEIQSGGSCPLHKAYCRRTIELDSALAVEAAMDSPDISPLAIETFGLSAYIGAKITVNDEPYGTLCFADTSSRENSFTDGERYFVELAARLAGQEFERRRYERELTARGAELDEREEHTRALLQASFDLVFRVDEDGVFTSVSPQVESLLGYPPDKYLGEHFVTMLPDDETVSHAQDLYEDVMTGETVQAEYFALDDASGGRRWVDLRVTPIYKTDDPGVRETVVGALGTVRDATDRYRRERLIRVLNRVLRHNLRNDMNIIRGYADSLANDLQGSHATYAARIRDTSDHLMELANTARTLEENLSDDPHRATENIALLLETVTNRVRERYPTATVNVSVPEDLDALTAPRLRTALLELLDNAAAHAGPDATIDVSARSTDHHVTIRVDDDGPGLPSNERAVLEVGDETPLTHGSGLGLWLVHWITQSIDGTLTVVDDTQGTTIELTLPRTSDTTPETPPGTQDETR